MAVRTQNTKILQAIVGGIATDVIKGQRQRLTPPTIEVPGVQFETPYVADDEAMYPTTRLVPEPPLDARHGNARLHCFAKVVVAPRSERPHATVDEARQVTVVDPEASDVAMQRCVSTPAGGQPQPGAHLAARATQRNRIAQLGVTPPLSSRHRATPPTTHSTCDDARRHPGVDCELGRGHPKLTKPCSRAGVIAEV